MPESLPSQIPVAVQRYLEEGSKCHREKRYEDAHASYLTALMQDELLVDGTNTSLYAYVCGEALRGMAASSGQMGTLSDISTGIKEANQALNQHEPLLPAYPEADNAVRLDSIVLGRLSLQKGIRRLRTGEPWPLGDFSTAGFNLRRAVSTEHRTEPSVQVEVNASWLFALLHVLQRTDGGRKGRLEAWSALRLGWRSEAKGAPSSNPTLTSKERFKARARAVGRPLGVRAVASLFGENAYDPNSRRQQLALGISEMLFVGYRRARQLPRTRA